MERDRLSVSADLSTLPSRKRSSQRTQRWREPDSNHRSRVKKSGRCQVPVIRPGSVEHWTLGGGAESSLEGRDIEPSVSPKDVRTSPYDLCAKRSDRRQSREGDRWFESTSLQQRVICEIELLYL